MTRVNLVSNTSFKTDTTGWSAAENIKKRIVNSQRSSITTKTITNLVFETILKLQLYNNPHCATILNEVKTRLS